MACRFEFGPLLPWSVAVMGGCEVLTERGWMSGTPGRRLSGEDWGSVRTLNSKPTFPVFLSVISFSVTWSNSLRGEKGAEWFPCHPPSEIFAVILTEVGRQACLTYVFHFPWGVCCVLSSFSCVWLFETPWAVARQAALSMGFSRQEYWSGLLGPPPGGRCWPIHILVAQPGASWVGGALDPGVWF